MRKNIMCFHNSMTKKAIEVAARYRRKYWREVDASIFEQYHINAFANPDYPIITSDSDIKDFKWGLIPYWTKTGQDAGEIRKMTYNARMETIFEKPSFRHPILSKRCIIPSTGYFEYHHNADKSTTPYFIFLNNTDIFSMGGIWDIWHDTVTGELYHTFSMITTPANKLTKEIHNGGRNAQRMPLILSPQDEERWLDPNLQKSEIDKLMRTFWEIEMDAYSVNPDFIHKDHHDKSILERA